MKYWYAVLLLVMAALMIVTHKIACRKNSSSLIKLIKRVLISAVSTTVVYAGAITVSSSPVAVVLYGLYFALTDILLIYVYLYVRRYSDIKKSSGLVRKILFGVAGVDSAMMLINIFIKNIVFTCCVSEDGITYDIGNITLLYYLHRFFIILLISMSLTLLIYKYFKSPKMYKKKYLVLFLMLAATAALDIFSLAIGINIDLAISVFGILGFAIYYFSFIFIPHDLVEQLLSAAVRNMDDGIVCFDSEGKCVYANDSVTSDIGKDQLTTVMNALFK